MTARSKHKRRLYLDVPFEQTDIAKALGARWDRSVKRWWAPKGSAVAEVLRRWVNGDDEVKKAARESVTVAGLIPTWTNTAAYIALFPQVDERQCNLTDDQHEILARAVKPDQSNPREGSQLDEPHYFLDVHYRDKDLAKRYGARWDKFTGLWYVVEDAKIAGFHKLKDMGIAANLVDGDPDITARLYSMAAKGQWTATFGDNAQKADAGLITIDHGGHKSSYQAATDDDVRGRFGPDMIDRRAKSMLNGPLSVGSGKKPQTMAEAERDAVASFRAQINRERAAAARDQARRQMFGKDSVFTQSVKESRARYYRPRRSPACNIGR